MGKKYYIRMLPKGDKPGAIVGGLGNHKGTLGYIANSKITAKRWRTECARAIPNRTFKIKHIFD